MEAASCVRAVVQAANQYHNNPSEAQLTHLQRQLEVLVSVTAKGSCLTYFNPTELLPTECLTCLTDILNDSQSKTSLITKTLALLTNLAQEEEIREAMHSTFHLTSTLAAYLRNTDLSLANHSVLQCVKLLQRITYNAKVSSEDNYVDELVKFLLKHIRSKESEMTQPCLGVLANLCRRSFIVQTKLKSMEDARSLYKCLMSYLSHFSQTTVVFALSTLSSLCLFEDLGEKLFNGKNINQIFQLMFNILVNGKSYTSQSFVVDLFTDILRHTKIQQYLSVFDHFSSCTKQVLQLLRASDTDLVCKIFELLLSFCSVNGLRCVVCRNLMESPAVLEAPQQQDLLSQHSMSEPFVALVHWAGQTVDTHDTASLLALDFLREAYEEMIDQGLSHTLTSRTDLILPLFTETLMTPLQLDSRNLKKQCQKIVKALQVMLTLCREDKLKVDVAKSVNSQICAKLTDFQLCHNHIGINLSRSSHAMDDWSEAGVDVVLYTLQLILSVKQHISNMEAQLVKLLQDSRMVPFMAYGMSSSCRERVKIGLRLASKAYSLPDFSMSALGDTVAANNTKSRQKVDKKELTVDLSPPAAKRLAYSTCSNKENVLQRSNHANGVPLRKDSSTTLDVSVQSLIEKMQSGLELKDVRTSEVINLYEHRLQKLQTKESHMQDLLEIKALSLSQADRVIADLRCRCAQSDAEASKLRLMLSDSERRCEEMQEQLNYMRLEREKTTSEVENLVQENNRLEAIAEEHKELTHNYNEQSQRLENTQRSLAALRQEHKSMSEMHEMLRRHNETLKQQHDVATQQLAELEDERKNLSRVLKEKETKVHELSRGLNKTESELKKTAKERDELEAAIDTLRETLGKTEAAKKQLQHQVSSLEVVCRKHEEVIAEREDLLNKQKVEIDKHSQIVALIHNLSGAKPEK